MSWWLPIGLTAIAGGYFFGTFGGLVLMMLALILRTLWHISTQIHYLYYGLKRN